MRTALLALAVCVPCIQALALLIFIWTQTPLVPWGDEWAMVPLLQHADAGTFSFADLWALHNGSHRIVLPRLTDLLLIDATHWNRQVLMTFDLGVALLAGGLIFACVYATLRKRRMAILLIAPLSLLYLSFAQYENWILPWQLTFIATIFGVSLCLYGFRRRDEMDTPTSGALPWRGAFVFALAGAVVASLSSFSGLFVWVAFFPSAARGGRVRAALWCASALAIGIPYLVGFGGENSTSPLHLAAFFVAALGAPIASLNLALARLFGALGLVAMGLALALCWRLKVNAREVEVWIELAVFSALAIVAETLGRAPYGNGFALISRYQEFSALWWIALAVIGGVALQHLRAAGRDARLFRSERDGQRIVVGSAALLAACVAMCLVSNVAGERTAVDWLAPMRAQQACVEQTPTPTPACLAPYFLEGLVPESDAQLVAYIRAHHMAIFATDGQ